MKQKILGVEIRYYRDLSGAVVIKRQTGRWSPVAKREYEVLKIDSMGCPGPIPRRMERAHAMQLAIQRKVMGGWF